MDLFTFQIKARKIMDTFGLESVAFNYMGSRKSFGWTNGNIAGVTSLEMSMFFVECNSEKECMDTLLHEIAHCLTWSEVTSGIDHGPQWEAKCKETGALPEKYWTTSRRNVVDPRREGVPA